MGWPSAAGILSASTFAVSAISLSASTKARGSSPLERSVQPREDRQERRSLVVRAAYRQPAVAVSPQAVFRWDSGALGEGSTRLRLTVAEFLLSAGRFPGHFSNLMEGQASRWIAHALAPHGDAGEGRGRDRGHSPRFPRRQ